MITIIDYDMGNLRSVQKGFEKVGATASFARHPEEIVAAQKLILPGVGAFRDAIAALKERQLIQPILEYVKTGKPLMGICLGQQLLFDRSYEDGDYEGLGLIAGEVVKFEPVDKSLKVPHMGWNSLTFRKESPITRGLPEGAFVYFVHSYYVKPKDAGVTVATASYDVDFAAIVQKDNVMATQFHPEKSQNIGLKILQNFAEL